MVPNPRLTDPYWCTGLLVQGCTEIINYLHYYLIYLLSKTRQCFILKNYQILLIRLRLAVDTRLLIFLENPTNFMLLMCHSLSVCMLACQHYAQGEKLKINHQAQTESQSSACGTCPARCCFGAGEQSDCCRRWTSNCVCLCVCLLAFAGQGGCGNRSGLPMSQISINQQLAEETLIMHVFKI